MTKGWEGGPRFQWLPIPTVMGEENRWPAQQGRGGGGAVVTEVMIILRSKGEFRYILDENKEEECQTAQGFVTNPMFPFACFLFRFLAIYNSFVSPLVFCDTVCHYRCSTFSFEVRSTRCTVPEMIFREFLGRKLKGFCSIVRIAFK